jgi:endonuclease/exonuclease/phosphatase family metal-dependent hydrolase
MKLLTYNICFEDIHFEIRINNIIQILLNELPDVICLQEVTHQSLNLILKSKLNKLYNINKTIMDTSYQNIILCKHRIQENKEIPFTNTYMRRTLQYITFEFNNQHYLIANIHLESEFINRYTKSNEVINTIQRKISQFNQMFSLLKQYNTYHVFIMGDTNITQRDEPYMIIPMDFIDIYLYYQIPKFMEYTYDYKKNDMVKGKFQSRLDRIYYKPVQSDFKYEITYSLIGTETNMITNTCPSDHFAILLEILIQN